MYKEWTVTKCVCDYCERELASFNLDPESKVHFCNDKCKERYYYEKDKVALPYKDPIKDKTTEFYRWGDDFYHDYPYQDRKPAKILYVYKMEDKSNTINNILIIQQSFSGTTYCFNMHQYDHDKTNAYTVKVDLTSDLLVGIIRGKSDLNLLQLYLD